LRKNKIHKIQKSDSSILTDKGSIGKKNSI
jgi:hypothetical protein